MSPLERKWWFIGPVAALTALCTISLIKAAGLPMGDLSAAQWLVYFLCFSAVNRVLSFSGWLLVLLISPSLAGSRPGWKAQ